MTKERQKSKYPVEPGITKKGYLTVIDIFYKKRIDSDFHESKFYLCRCDCGNIVEKFHVYFRQSKEPSCGCVRKVGHNLLHGQSGTLTHRSWTAMVSRCDPELATDREKLYYVEKGVTVCSRWLEPDGRGYLNFVEDVGERPSKEFSIDRWPNKEGNYEPGNVRWATKSEQEFNKRPSSRNTTSVIGVSWSKSNQKWVAYLTKNKKHVLLQMFDCFDEAVSARLQAELEHYGYCIQEYEPDQHAKC